MLSLGERRNHCCDYLSSIQHNNLTPYMLVVDSSLLTWTRLIWRIFEAHLRV